MFDNNGSFLLALFEIFIFFAWFFCLFWIFGDLFRSKDLGGWAKTLWVLFIIIVPFLGILVYLIARGPGMTQRSLDQQKDIQAAQAEYIKSVAGSGSSVVGDRTDRVGQAAARHRRHLPAGVRHHQDEGPRHLTRGLPRDVAHGATPRATFRARRSRQRGVGNR